MREIIQRLIREGFEYEEAKDWIREVRQRILEGEDPEEILYDIGLEPDYVMDLL